MGWAGWRVKGGNVWEGPSRRGGSTPGRTLVWRWEQGVRGRSGRRGGWRAEEVAGCLDDAEPDLYRDWTFILSAMEARGFWAEDGETEGGRPLPGCHRGWWSPWEHRGAARVDGRVWGWCPGDEREAFPGVTEEWVKGGIWWKFSGDYQKERSFLSYS